MKKFYSYIRLLRCEQWAKNVFLFAPLIFSKHLFEIVYTLKVFQGFFAFSLASSFVYIINDIFDREADAQHPVKKNRPIASGAVSIFGALMIALCLFVASLLSSIFINTTFVVIISIYLIMNALYSIHLKKVVLVDVFLIATGFMLRILAGAYAIEVEISHWLVLCSLFLSLFLAISKRRNELVLTNEVHTDSKQSRFVLQFYSIEFLDQLITVAASGIAISYALYTVADRTIRVFHTENLIFTTIFVLFGIFRYIYLIRYKRTEDNPTQIILTDVPLLVTIVAWFVACIVIIYFNEIFELVRL